MTENALHPAKPQPYDPPSPAAAVWATPQSPDALNSFASYLYAQVVWGREPHPSQVSEIELIAWESVRERWETATLNFLKMLDGVGHIALEFQTPREKPERVSSIRC